jgi:hypothetical protein
MNFKPKLDKESNKEFISKLLPEDEYPFEVADAEETVSKNGNEMIKLTLCLWDKEGKEHVIFDYLLEAMAFKLRKFAAITGLMRNYETGKIDAKECLHKCGKVKLIIQKGKPNPEGGFYPDRNSVKEYFEGVHAHHVAKQEEIDINDDVPF